MSFRTSTDSYRHRGHLDHSRHLEDRTDASKGGDRRGRTESRSNGRKYTRSDRSKSPVRKNGSAMAIDAGTQPNEREREYSGPAKKVDDIATYNLNVRKPEKPEKQEKVSEEQAKQNRSKITEIFEKIDIPERGNLEHLNLCYKAMDIEASAGTYYCFHTVLERNDHPRAHEFLEMATTLDEGTPHSFFNLDNARCDLATHYFQNNKPEKAYALVEKIRDDHPQKNRFVRTPASSSASAAAAAAPAKPMPSATASSAPVPMAVVAPEPARAVTPAAAAAAAPPKTMPSASSFMTDKEREEAGWKIRATPYMKASTKAAPSPMPPSTAPAAAAAAAAPGPNVPPINDMQTAKLAQDEADRKAMPPPPPKTPTNFRAAPFPMPPSSAPAAAAAAIPPKPMPSAASPLPVPMAVSAPEQPAKATATLLPNIEAYKKRCDEARELMFNRKKVDAERIYDEIHTEAELKELAAVAKKNRETFSFDYYLREYAEIKRDLGKLDEAKRLAKICVELFQSTLAEMMLQELGKTSAHAKKLLEEIASRKG